MQHDTVIDNAAGAAVRADINSALAALFTMNSGASAPAVTLAYMPWADTSSGNLKLRNAANSAWVTLGPMATTNFGLLPLAGGTLTGALNEKGFTVAAHATTCDIWSGGNFCTLSGSAVTFTDVADAPIADAWRWVRFNAAHTLTDGANISVKGGTRTVANGWMGLFHAITTSTFEVWLFTSDGAPVVASTNIVSMKTITDTTDIALAVAAAATQSNVGSTFSVTIPANGFIRLAAFSGRILNNGSAAIHGVSFGLRIGSTNYWFSQVSNNGTYYVGMTLDNSSNASSYVEYNGHSFGGNVNNAINEIFSPVMDITAIGIPTGTQTVQLIMGYKNNQSTLKGTAKTTRVILEFIG